MNMLTITADHVIELLKEVTDNTLREKIIQLAASKTSSSSHSIPDDKKVKDDFVYSAPYSLSKVHNRPSSKQTMVFRDSSFDDLKGEIEHLKEEIKFLKQNHIIYDHHLTQIKSANSRGKSKVDDYPVEENTLANSVNIYPKQNMFLGIIMEHPWMTKSRGKGRERSSSVSSRSSYRSSSSSSTPITQRGGMSLVKLNSKTQEKTFSSIHLEDILESDPLYAKLQEYITQKQKTNFDKSKVVTRRPIKWEEIDFPQEWVIENATQPQNNINIEVSEIEQLSDGTVKIRFHEPLNILIDNRSMSSRISRSNSSYISHVDYIVQVPSRASTSQIRETYRCDNIKIDKDNIARPIRKASSDLDITESEMNHRVKEKIKSLDIEDNLKDSLYKIMLNSDSGSRTEYSSEGESSTSEDLKALQQENYLTSEYECSPCQQGMACEKDEEDDLYKIYDQFKELSLHVIDNDKVIELLQNIKDLEIRAQIIGKISDSKEKDHIPKEIPTKEGSYTMAEVKNLLLERRKMISSPTTISDLKEEINNLKEDIIRLKKKNVVIDKNPEGKLHGQEIIDLINVTISKYYDTATMEPPVIEDLSPFKKITRKLQMKKGLISKSEAITIYMEEVKKDLMKNLDIDIKDDISMVSASHTNKEEDACIAGEGQDVDEEEVDLETILKRYQQQLEESSSASTTDKGKGKINQLRLRSDIVNQAKVVTRRPIKWEEIDFPQEWVIENATQPQNNINAEVSEIEQLNDGTAKIRFHDPTNILIENHSMSSRMTRSNSSYISPIDYIVQVPSRASTSQIRETYRCDNIKIDKDNIARPNRRASSDLDITESEMNFSVGITG
ncbi:hypothetical protein H5410_016063 [Solanum commersonii]|uniref:Uncharacterized protein n=1 Tax=Solanum commersonii TaxID=4109 RepID=A0A9J5ZWH1_SOLCO|nr:hypothetical protein H5410_016063 [Solanum commersonii]